MSRAAFAQDATIRGLFAVILWRSREFWRGLHLDELVEVAARDVCEADEGLSEFAPALRGHGSVQELDHLLLCHAVQLLQERLRLPLRARTGP